MPVFTALMASAFGSEDPFGTLVRNDAGNEGDNVRVLPDWVAESLARDAEFRAIVR